MADGLATERARADRGHDSPPRPHAGHAESRLAGLIPPGASVLWIGPIDADEAAAAEALDASIRVIPRSQCLDPGGVHPNPGEIADLDFGRARYDVIVADDLLGRVARTGPLLDALRRALPAGGRLIASVPNAAHPAILAALARGESPYQVEGGPLDPGQARLFTREALASTLEASDFALGRIRGVLDPSGQVSAWLAVAHALPIAGLECLREEARTAAIGRDEAERAAESLRDLLAQSRRAIDAGQARVAAALERERSTRAALADVHEAMRLRDEEYGATVRALLTRMEELEPLRRERDAAHRHALAAEARCRALEMRVEHILMELPRRVARKLRALLSRRGT